MTRFEDGLEDARREAEMDSAVEAARGQGREVGSALVKEVSGGARASVRVWCAVPESSKAEAAMNGRPGGERGRRGPLAGAEGIREAGRGGIVLRWSLNGRREGRVVCAVGNSENEPPLERAVIKLPDINVNSGVKRPWETSGAGRDATESYTGEVARRKGDNGKRAHCVNGRWPKTVPRAEVVLEMGSVGRASCRRRRVRAMGPSV